jgi:L-malate glycosyltransferase
MPTVSIIQPYLARYRVPLFEIMHARLREYNITLKVFCGQPLSSDLKKGMVEENVESLEWAETIPTTFFFNGRLCHQPVRHFARDSDLLIVTQENRFVANHALLAWRLPGKIAFWGHGANFQGNSWSLSEMYKRWTAPKVDWWFAYTDLSVELIKATGFSPKQITCLNNAVDVTALQGDYQSIDMQDTEDLRTRLGLTDGFTCIFLGSLYPAKRLGFLVEAFECAKIVLKDLNLVIIGAGAYQEELEHLIRGKKGVHLVGPKFGEEKALFLTLGDAIVNPGLTGLNILDAFACGLPFLTTDCGIHSPEISYLDETNGLITDNDVGSFSGAIVTLANKHEMHGQLREGCLGTASRFTLEAMAENFVAGIMAALDH